MNIKIVALIATCSCIQLAALTDEEIKQQLMALSAQLPPSKETIIRQQLQELAIALGYTLAPVELTLEPAAPVAPPIITTNLSPITAVLYKSIVAALTPLMARYPAEKLLSAGQQELTEDDALEQTYMIDTFVERLTKKLETLAPEAREFIATKQFAQQSFGKMLLTTLVTLQQLLNQQLEMCKGIKSPSVTVKELKKITTSSAKHLNTLVADFFGL